MASQLTLSPLHETAGVDDTPDLENIEAAIADLRAGGTAIVWGGAEADGSGVLVVAAEHADADAVNLMAREARGLVCVALAPDHCRRLGLGPVCRGDDRRPAADFMVSIEARSGTTTGISAHDRAATIAAAIARDAMPDDLVTPGHVFPLRTAADGVLEFAGNAEAAIDLVRMAGLTAAAVVCTVLDDNGDLASQSDLHELGARLGARQVPVSMVADRRRKTNTR